jgi:hypothetical protein
VPDAAPGWDESLLTRLAPTIAYPPTPLMVPSIRLRLQAPPAPARLLWARRAAIAAAVLVVAVALALVVSSETREAVADLFGLSVDGEHIERLPTPAPGVTPTPFPTSPPFDDLASRITAEQARAILGAPVATPAGAAEPTSFYALNAPADTVVILRYPGFDLWEFATDQGGFLKKLLGGVAVTQTTVSGATAYWIPGGTRLVSFVDASGREVAGTQHTTAASALIWSRDGCYYRLEGFADLETARAVAVTVR